ncbi:MAG: hypothetical protein A9957_06625 [Methanohalophilus sp. DAL1]|nr:MAG: hypothetical protein A9957_06625 [Methanohalophilus sp. DAL1]
MFNPFYLCRSFIFHTDFFSNFPGSNVILMRKSDELLAIQFAASVMQEYLDSLGCKSPVPVFW